MNPTSAVPIFNSAVEFYQDLWYCRLSFRQPQVPPVTTKLTSLQLPVISKQIISVPNVWIHDDVTKWKHFPRYWPFVRGIHRSPVNSPHRGYWRGALMFFSICARMNGWVNNRGADDLRRHRAHYDVIVMCSWFILQLNSAEMPTCPFRSWAIEVPWFGTP